MFPDECTPSVGRARRRRRGLSSWGGRGREPARARLLSFPATTALSLSLSLSRSLALSHSLTRSLSRALTLSLSHPLTLSLSHSLTLSLSHSLTLSHSLLHSPTLSLSHTVSHSLTLAHALSAGRGATPGGRQAGQSAAPAVLAAPAVGVRIQPKLKLARPVGI